MSDQAGATRAGPKRWLRMAQALIIGADGGARAGRYKILEEVSQWRNGTIKCSDVADFLLGQNEARAGVRKAPQVVTRRQSFEEICVRTETLKPVPYFDRSCPLRWAETRHYRETDRAGALPAAMSVLDAGYRIFLPIRPSISRFFVKLQNLGRRAGQDKRQ